MKARASGGSVERRGKRVPEKGQTGKTEVSKMG